MLLTAAHQAWRFIPACAGNTAADGPPRASIAVHPRVCGEHALVHRGEDHPDGSSPRVRGTPFRELIRMDGDRFIPACAGNTSRHVEGIERQAVHPRVCGEHASSGYMSSGVTGSSPRVRGTLAERYAEFRPIRFIPACAGNTASARPPTVESRVHPRVCGEHEISNWLGRSTAGSSPRVRGTLPPRAAAHARDRFIPACAGNTYRSPRKAT